MWQCKDCHQFKFSTDIVCNCRLFKIVCEGDEYEIYAQGNHDAAEEFAKQYNEDGDYDLMDNTIDITIIDEIRNTVSNFSVGAETDIYYRIHKCN